MGEKSIPIFLPPEESLRFGICSEEGLMEDTITCTSSSHHHHAHVNMAKQLVINLGNNVPEVPVLVLQQQYSLTVSFTNICCTPVVYLDRHWRYKDICKWPCLQGDYHLVNDTGVYMVCQNRM